MDDRPWFHVRPVARGTWLVAEPGHVNGWLLAGRDRAVLVDTGLGIAAVRPVVEAVLGPDLPVTAVNTHAHHDHVGGNHEFDDVAIHAAGVDLLAAGTLPAVRAAYLAHTRRLLAAAREYREIDRRLFHLLSDDADPRPLPVGFDDDTWVRPGPPPGPVPTALHDGDVLDLGGRRLEVLHTPGHSPDSICLLDDREGILLGGDTLNTGPIYAQAPECDLAAFARSTARLASVADDVSLVAVGHFGRVVVEPRFVRDVAEAFDRVVSGGPVDAERPATDCDGDDVREVVVGPVSILLPR